MVDIVIQLIVVFLVAGFIFWIWTKLKAVVAQFIAEPFMSIVDILVYVLVGAIVLFYAVIPLIRALGHAAGPVFR